MLDKRSKAKLDELMIMRKRNIARLIYISHRYIHEWALKKWHTDGWLDMHPDYMRIISCVGAESVNNNELAKRARVSKQAMSKMVNNMVKQGFIEIQPDPTDSRSKIISLSKNGVDFFVYFNSFGKELQAKFADIIGDSKTEKLIDIMSELIEGIIAQERANP